MRKGMRIMVWILVWLWAVPSLRADETVVAKVTIIVASNKGNDFNLENDAFRDQLKQVFSYSSYEQVKEYSLRLEKVKQEVLTIPGDYQFVLTYRGQQRGKTLIGALIQKDGRKFLSTDVIINGTGPVFLGGPPLDSGELLIVIETLP